MPFLVDSDWAINAMAADPRALPPLRNLTSQGVTVSLVKVAEVYAKAFRSVNPQAKIADLRAFFAPFRWLTLTEPIVERFAGIRSHFFLGSSCSFISSIRYIPPAVHDEVLVAGDLHAEVAGLVAAGLLVTRELAEPVALGGRNRGEAEAIALAQDLGGGTPLILDDGRARRTAQQRGLHVIGSGGVLVLAKSRHAIQSVRLELDRLRNVSLYLSEATYHALSEVAGEATAEP